MNAGFFERRVTPEFPDNNQMVNVAEWTRQHSVSKIDGPKNLSDLDQLRKRAIEGGLW